MEAFRARKLIAAASVKAPPKPRIVWKVWLETRIKKESHLRESSGPGVDTQTSCRNEVGLPVNGRYFGQAVGVSLSGLVNTDWCSQGQGYVDTHHSASKRCFAPKHFRRRDPD